MRFFNKVALQTPESVELDFTLAGIGNRAYALVIDDIILGLILIIFLLVWASFAYFLYQVINIFGSQNTEFTQILNIIP